MIFVNTTVKRPYQRSISTSFLSAIFIFCCAAGYSKESEVVAFNKFEIVPDDSTNRPTLLSGFFTGRDNADIALLDVTENSQFRIRIYTYNDKQVGWLKTFETTLKSQFIFADVMNIAGQDRLILYDQGEVSWLDLDTATQRPLLNVLMNLNTTGIQNVLHININRDLNCDDYQDFLIPDIDGFWVSLQSPQGSFSELSKLGPSEPFQLEAALDKSGFNRSLTYGEEKITEFTAPIYSARVYQTDHNQDGLCDLTFWNNDHFDVYYQNEDRKFIERSTSVPATVPIESDGLYSHILKFSGFSNLATMFGLGEKVGTTFLVSLRDMNNDSLTDLITLTLEGRSLFRQSSVYKVYYGENSAEGIAFSADNATSVEPGGKSGAAEIWGYSERTFKDLDGDDQVDLILKDIDIDPLGMLRAITSKSIGVSLEFFRMTNGNYPNKPSFVHKIRTNQSFWGDNDPFFPAILVGDVNGDGREDLIAGGKTRDQLEIFLGIPGPNLFSGRPIEVRMAMPTDGERVWLADLNNDGKQDIYMHDFSPSESNKLTILISR